MSYFDPDRVPKYRPDIPNTAYTPHPLRKTAKFERDRTLKAMVEGESYITSFGYHPTNATIRIMQVGFKEYHVRQNWDGVMKTVPFYVVEKNFKPIDKEVEVALCS